MRSFTLLLLLASAQAAQGQSPLMIEVFAPGRAAPTVEQTVLAPLEQHLRDVVNVRHVRGLALDGRCLLRLDLAREADPELVRLLVQNRIALAKTKLPPSCAAEILPPVEDAFMLVTVEPSAEMTVAKASQVVYKTIWPRLANVPGVARIRVVGATEQRFRIMLDPHKLKRCKVEEPEVVAAIQDSLKNVEDLVVMGHQVSLKKTETAQHLGEIPMKLASNVYLRDVASIHLVDESQEDCRIASRTEKDTISRRAIFVLVQLSPGKRNLSARKGVEKTLTDLRGELPPGVRCEQQMLPLDTTTVVVRFPGTMPAEQRVKKAQAAAAAMLELSQVRKVFCLVQPHPSEAIFWIVADADEKADCHKLLRAKLAPMKAIRSRVGGLYSPLSPWPSGGAQLVIRLQGNSFEYLHRVAEQLGERLRDVKGIVDVDHLPRMGHVATIDVDREKAGLSGVTVRDVHKALAAHADKIELPVFGGRHLIVESPKIADKTPREAVKDLEEMPLPSTNALVNFILRDVATVRLTNAPIEAIPHENGRPCVFLFANLEGRTLKDVRTVIERLTEGLADTGVRIEVE